MWQREGELKGKLSHTDNPEGIEYTIMHKSAEYLFAQIYYYQAEFNVVSLLLYVMTVGESRPVNSSIFTSWIALSARLLRATGAA